MYKRFTGRARRIMQLANREAQRFGHEYVSTEHILLGLIKEGSGIGACALKDSGVTLLKIRLEVEKLDQRGPDAVRPERHVGTLLQTPRVKQIIEYSTEEARNLNHNYIGTEHILLGLLRDQEDVPAQVLVNLGLKLEEVRERVFILLGCDPQGTKPQMHFVLEAHKKADDGTIFTTLNINGKHCGMAAMAAGEFTRLRDILIAANQNQALNVVVAVHDHVAEGVDGR